MENDRKKDNVQARVAPFDKERLKVLIEKGKIVNEADGVRRGLDLLFKQHASILAEMPA